MAYIQQSLHIDVNEFPVTHGQVLQALMKYCRFDSRMTFSNGESGNISHVADMCLAISDRHGTYEVKVLPSTPMENRFGGLQEFLELFVPDSGMCDGIELLMEYPEGLKEEAELVFKKAYDWMFENLAELADNSKDFFVLMNL